MNNTHTSLFLERRLLRFAGPEQPSAVPERDAREVPHPAVENGQFAYDSWEDFRAWIDKNDAISKQGDFEINKSIFDMLHDGDVAFVLPDGTEYRPTPTGTYYEGYYEPDLLWSDGYGFSYEKGLLKSDGTPVDAKIRSVKLYSSSKEREKETISVLKNANIVRLKAEEALLRERIETNLSMWDEGRQVVDGLMETSLNVRQMMEQGNLEDAVRLLESVSEYLWNASKEQRKREATPEAPVTELDTFLNDTSERPARPHYYGNKFELQYTIKAARNDDGSPNEEGIASVLSELDRDAAAIGKDYVQKQLEAKSLMKRFTLLHNELSSRGDFTDGRLEWYESAKKRIDTM